MANIGLVTTLAAESIIECMYGVSVVKAVHRAVQPLPVNMQRYYALRVYTELCTVWTGSQSSEELAQLKQLKYMPINWSI